MIHPTQKYRLIPLVVLALIMLTGVAHGATLTLAYGGAGVYPQDASANSERYFRCIVTLSPASESLGSLTLSGAVSPGQVLYPKPNGNWNDARDGVTRYLASGGSTETWVYTVGPFAGSDIYGLPHAPGEVIGQVFGSDGIYQNQFTFSARIDPVSGGTSTSLSASGTYRTNGDNADILEWFSGAADGVDPLGVVDGPVPGADFGSSSNTYRFRVQYKIAPSYGLNLLPRWGTPNTPPGPYGNYADFDGGRANARVRGDRDEDWWIYFPSVNRAFGDVSNTYPRFDDFTDTVGYYVNYNEPEVVLIIDGDRTRPHFMQREDPSNSNARGLTGIRYFYELLPTDYQQFMDNMFLFPYDPPGPDPLDGQASGINGRPSSNNYVAMQVGGHTYEFIATDDFSPPDGNRAWLQVGRPGNSEQNQYMKPIIGGNGQMQVDTVQRRFNDADGAAGGYGYPYDSQSRSYPDVNPMLTAHPYFVSGSIRPGISTGSLVVNPPDSTFAANPIVSPFSPEVGAGPTPALRVTNDDTILPNFVNIRPNTDPEAPFRGGKWTAASTYTFRINYWQSRNHPPDFIRVMMRKNNNGAAPGAWQGFTMEKASSGDNTYTDGCIYQYQVTPDQLPGGGGPGDYNYYFVASDGNRTVMFPKKPDATTWGSRYIDFGTLGVAPAATANSYYAFRVNHPPVLSNQQVTQPVGRTGDDYQFKVTYTDVDGEMLNTASKGDRAFEMSLYLDLFGSPNGQAKVASVLSETDLTYSTATGTGYAANELVGNTVEISTGPAAGKVFTITANTAAQITVAPVPGSGLVSAGVAAGASFRIARWFHGTMLPADPSDTNYKDGKDYTFNTATHVVLGPGVHRYYFVFRDDWGSWLYPNDSNVRVEGEQVRYPTTGEFAGPEVIQTTPPVLKDFRYTPRAISGPDGTTATSFVFSVTYISEENTPPTLIRLGIDGTAAAPATVLNMTQADPADNVYSDGALFVTPPIKLAEGTHIFRAQTSDGSARYPNTTPFVFAGPPQDPNDNASTPLDSVPGPLVAANTPPTLSFPANDNGPTSPGLLPKTGSKATEFTYSVIYTDTDRFAGVAGNPPDYVQVYIDNVAYNMTKVDDTDNDYTDGVLYQYKISGLEQAKPHTYFFVASDGLDRARLPEQGATPTRFNGPVVDEPPGPPLSLVAQDTPNDNGGSINLTWNASDDDGGGANDVTEYRVYRATAAAGPFTLVNTIGATHVPAYAAQDKTAVTGTQYWYLVRAFDHTAESANSNIAGPVSAIDNIPPQPPTAVTVTNPGMGGTLKVDWTLSTDDGAGNNDVKAYRIYHSTDGVNWGTSFIGQVLNGITTFNDTSVTDGTAYYYMVRAWDGSQESVNSNVAGPATSTDNQPPAIEDQSPAPNDVNVPINSQIKFSLVDNGSGVDQSTLSVSATANGVDFSLGTPTITGTPAKYMVTFQPPSVFAYRAVIAITVTVKDRAGRQANVTWQFTVAGPPTFSVSGIIKATDGTPKAGVLVTAGTQSATTDATGAYTIAGVEAGDCQVTPKLRGFAFTPHDRKIKVSANVTGINFGWEAGFDIGGTVVNKVGQGMQGVTISDGYDSTITAADGSFRLQDQPAGTYKVIPSLAKHQFTPASLTVTIGPGLSGLGLQFVAWVYSVDLPAGLAFVAVPLLPQDTNPQSVFGTDLITYRWDPSATPPAYLNSINNATSPTMQVRPGRGFWVRTSSATSVAISGTMVQNNQSTSLSLLDGWNMVGNPYDAPLPWANINLTAGGTVRNFGYIYNTSTRSYQLVSNLPGIGQLTTIPRNAGFWMRSQGQQTVSINALGIAAASTEKWVRTAGEFVIPICAEAGGTADTCASIGVLNFAKQNPDAYQIENPPALKPFVDVYFVGKDGKLLTCDIRGESAQSMEYKFAVTTDQADTVVKLSLPDLSQVPRDKSVILVDETTGKRIWARTLNTYTYNSGNGGVRQFRLEIVPATSGGLVVTATASDAKASGTAITYTLSQQATVEVTVLNMAGREIRMLRSGKVATAGINTEAWDLRNQSGSRVPSGRYLVRITAAGEDGQRVTAMAPLNVR